EVNNRNSVLKHYKTTFMPSTLVTSIASYLLTQHQIFKDQILMAPVVSSPIKGFSTSKLLMINTIFKKYTENIHPLSEPKQN
ncbi:30924_t:CDS:1, partial [Racocetra persica]